MYSSAETLAIFAKNTHFAMRFSKQLGIDPQGNINEFVPTVPDHIVPVPKTLPNTYDELLADPSVLKALELAGLSGWFWEGKVLK